MRILFTTVPLAGHLNPLVPLAWAFRSLGHDVLVATSSNFVGAVLRAGLPAVPAGPPAGVADLVAEGASGLVTDSASASGAAAKRYASGGAFGRIAKRNLPGVLALTRSWEPDLIVSERAEFAGPVAAAGHGIPQVELHWGVPALPEYRAAAAVELGPELASLGLADLPDPVLTLDPWPPGLRLPHAAGHQALRHIPYDGDIQIPGWAFTPRVTPRICLTMGTVVPRFGTDGAAGTVLPVVERLAALGVEVVVAVDDDVAASWPALPAAVRHAGRLPLSQVLPACDVVVTHGGHGTTLTALAAGVPQVVLPRFDDAFANADAVVGARAGVRLLPEDVTPQAVADRVRELLQAPGYARAAGNVAAEIAAQPSTVEVAHLLAEHAPAKARRHLRSVA